MQTYQPLAVVLQLFSRPSTNREIIAKFLLVEEFEQFLDPHASNVRAGR
jgi:hypothetical protein